MAARQVGNGRGMTNPSEDLLATTEGVDEGSARSTAEGRTDPSSGALVGQRAAQGPDDVEAEPAPPVDATTEQAREVRGTGQQLEAGEG